MRTISVPMICAALIAAASLSAPAEAATVRWINGVKHHCFVGERANGTVGLVCIPA